MNYESTTLLTHLSNVERFPTAYDLCKKKDFRQINKYKIETMCIISKPEFIYLFI